VDHFFTSAGVAVAALFQVVDPIDELGRVAHAKAIGQARTTSDARQSEH
jgi:hypothetical protein